ncbi:MAG TPA: protein kinase, partial [Gemmataceae bacterium]|nr:protein kinase [Gemmataceae bacterium]
MNQVQPCQAAVPLIAQMRKLWQQGQPVDAQAILAHHPELVDDKDVVLDVAFEEFCLRQAQGETLDPVAFAARFPICHDSLCLTMQCNDFVADGNFYLLKDKRSIPWPEPGDKLLGFELLRQLGKGSFARVNLGKEVALGNRLVALKVSKVESAEAEILGRLRHDNIVPVYSVQKDPHTGFNVVCMPFLGKTTLLDVLKKAFAGGIPRRANVILDAAKPDGSEEKEQFSPSKVLLHGTYVDGVVAMGVQLADALAFVHERFIYHRDLKPSNILVRPDGRPMLLDFNLSFDQRSKEQNVGGTLQYMAPEHLRATDRDFKGVCMVDGRSDLFSLGVILYELLAGKHPFAPILDRGTEEEIREQVYQRHQRGYQPLQKENPGVDTQLARIVDQCLANDPARRFQTAGNLAAALRKCCSPGQRLLRRARRHPRILVAVGAALLGVVVTLAAVLFMREPYAVRNYKEGIIAYQDRNYAQAVESLDRSLAQEQNVQAYLARGRAYLQLGEKQRALEDFNAADQFQPCGQTKACLAYGLSQLKPPQWRPAAFNYEKAIENGFATSEVYHNLAYCWMHIRGSEDKALAALKKAIALDPNNQLAYYRRVRLETELFTAKLAVAMRNLDIVLAQQKKPAAIDVFKKALADEFDKNVLTRDGLTAVRKMFEIGPASGLMHWEAARFYVLAHKLEPRWKELALDHLQKAIEGGMTVAQVKADTILKADVILKLGL